MVDGDRSVSGEGNAGGAPDLGSLSATQAAELDRACDRFEAAWRAGGSPRAEDHLGNAEDALRSTMLAELLAIEILWRRRRGEHAAESEYHERLPGCDREIAFAFGLKGLRAGGPESRLTPVMPAPAANGLLLGLLAFQNNFIDRDALVAALGAWVADKTSPFGQLLVDRGAMDRETRALLEALARKHLEAHANDPSASLAAIGAGRSTRERLGAIADADLQATLAHIPAVQSDTDAGETGAYAFGSATTDGQRFRVLRPHAKGGLGAVFVALDAELNREVALKQILDRHADDPVSRQRFLMEAEITGGLEHPGIVPVYGLGAYQGGRPYYAMRFVKGDNLKEAIEQFHADLALRDDAGRRSLQLRQLLRRFTDICNAIDYAHSRGVLHRDIKPGNVIVGRHGETLVVDWGLAKALGRVEPGESEGEGERALVPSSASGSAETLPGSALGTPAYMSPEQAAGDLDQLGSRSDVYGLGATLFCLLTGKPPFEGEVLEVLRAVQRGAFPSPRKLDPTIDRSLEAVCLKAMAVRPDDRYGSPRALAEDIERWMADEPVTALREPWATRAWRWVRKHRTLTTAAAAALLAGLIGLGTVVAVVTAKNSDLRVANAATKQAENLADARLDRAMAAIEDYFSGVSEEALKGGQLPPALRDRLLEKPRQFYEELSRELAARPRPSLRERYLMATGQDSLGQILKTLGLHSEAHLQSDAAIAGFNGLVAAQPNVRSYQYALAGGYGNLGLLLSETGDTLGARAAFDRAMAEFQALVAAQPNEPKGLDAAARTSNNYGNLFRTIGDTGGALAAFRQAVAAREALVAAHPTVPEYRNGLALSYTNLGILLGDTGDSVAARDTYGKAIAASEALVAAHPGVPEYRAQLALGFTNLAKLLDETGDSRGSLEPYGKAIAAYEGLVAVHPSVAEYRAGLALGYGNLSPALYGTADVRGAAEAAGKAAAANEALVASQPAVPEYRNRLVANYNNLGSMLLVLGDRQRAREAYDKAIAVSEALVSAYPSQPGFRNRLGVSQHNLADLLVAGGQHEEAASLFQRAAGNQRAALDAAPQMTFFRQMLSAHYQNLSASLRALGRADEAAGATRERIKLWPGNAAELYNAACDFALCSRLATGAGPNRALADEAMATLRGAVAAGWNDGAWMNGDADLSALHGRDEFRRMVLDLLDRSMPPNPFASPSPTGQ
jgi:serine/threonine-protein kinase